MRIPTAIVLTCLLVPLALMGCQNPCQNHLDKLRDRVLQFISDRDPLTEGDQACGTDVGSDNYDQICDFALQAINNRWPYYDCSSCDAAEIKLCGCYDENSWTVDAAGNPAYPGVVYCLASVYRIRDLCDCQPCEAPNEEQTISGQKRCVSPEGDNLYGLLDCYDPEGNRVCKQPATPVLNHPNLQQTDTCDAIVANFECASFDADLDGVPDQYDGGQDRFTYLEAEDPECIGGPLNADEWEQWFREPISLYDGGRIFIDADGGRDDVDIDGVSNTCDNCPDNPNGFNCLQITDREDYQKALRLCDKANLVGDGVSDKKLSREDFVVLSGSVADACLDHLNAKAPFFAYCDANDDDVTTREEVLSAEQIDSDGDGFGDACDPI